MLSSLILTNRATTGSIVDFKKIESYCPECDPKEIQEILDCFVEEGMLRRSETFVCRNGHYFTPSDQERDLGYDCPKCAEMDIHEDDRYIDADEMDECYVYTTYRISSETDIDIFQAKAFLMAGDVENAVRIAIKAYREEAGDSATKEGALQKIKEWLPIAGSGTVVADKLPSIVENIWHAAQQMGHLL